MYVVDFVQRGGSEQRRIVRDSHLAELEVWALECGTLDGRQRPCGPRARRGTLGGRQAPPAGYVSDVVRPSLVKKDMFLLKWRCKVCVSVCVAPSTPNARAGG